MVSAPPFWPPAGRGLDPPQDLSQALLGGRFDPVFAVEFAVGRDQRAGAAHDEGDLVIAIALVGEKNDTCECRDVVLNATDCVIEPAGDLVGFEALDVESHGLDAVGLARADVLLLAAGGNGDVAATQGLDIADDGAEAAVEQAEGKVLVAEQPALFPRLCGDAEDAGAAQAVDAMIEADLIVLLAGIEREQDGDLLAFLERLAGGLVGGDDEQFDLAEAELVVGVVEAEGEDLLDGIKDGLGDEGGAVGTQGHRVTFS